MTVALAALCAAAAAGAAAPAAAAGLGAAQIDAFLADHDSPMTGTGATFVAEGYEHGVDPAFLVAITGAETSFGQLLYGQDGDQSTYNAFNWFYGPTWPQSDFSSWDEAIARVAQGLAGELYYGSGLFSVLDIAPRYCPDGTDAWIANVTAFLQALGGDPGDTRLTAAGPPAVQPGLVALDGRVTLDKGRRTVGRDVTVRFTIRNTGGASLTVDGVTLAVRGPDGRPADLASHDPFTLVPGARRAIVATWHLEQAGEWYGWIQVDQGGVPSLVGAERAFSFRAALPRQRDLRLWSLHEQRLSPAL